jgi:hypothetical protein
LRRRLLRVEQDPRDFESVVQRQWLKVRALERERHDERQREALQLVRATVLYQAHSFRHLGELLHKRWRLQAPPPLVDGYWNEEVDELPFGLFERPGVMIGQMHLASAAVRLPVALQKTIEAYPDSEQTFDGMWDRVGGDWCRKRIKAVFATLKRLDHCLTKQLGMAEQERLQHALAIVMVIRDDFGHGEVGRGGPGSYKAQRKAVVDSLHTCRIVEAQQLLTAWTIERLS